MPCVKIKSGDMRHRITLQTLSTVTGDGGQKTDTWNNTAVVWAGVKTKGHNPIERADKLEFITTTIFTTRYSSSYLPCRRIVFGSRTFNVVRVNNIDEKDRVIEFTCTEDGK